MLLSPMRLNRDRCNAWHMNNPISYVNKVKRCFTCGHLKRIHEGKMTGKSLPSSAA